MLYGSHLSIAGGMVNALNEAEKLKMDTVQVFTKNQRQWKVKPLDEGDKDAWLAKLAELGASPLASIRTAGGGAANAAWTRMRRRALGVPVKDSLSEHAAVGTARLAWRGIGHAN